MHPEKIREILAKVSRRETDVEAALSQLRDLPFEDLGFARLDHHRELRLGVPEIVFGENKEIVQILSIVRRMTDKSRTVLISRIDAAKGSRLLQEFPQGKYHETARLFALSSGTFPLASRGKLFILAAGTSDIPVAEEALVTAQTLGNEVDRLYDVGVAGLNRLLPEIPRIREASVLIVIAGMEGALPSVVAGLVGRPVIAVPTSIGYGSSFGGVTALLAMLNSCVPGVTVVNIDNGVGAAVAAHLINSR